MKSKSFITKIIIKYKQKYCIIKLYNKEKGFDIWSKTIFKGRFVNLVAGLELKWNFKFIFRGLEYIEVRSIFVSDDRSWLNKLQKKKFETFAAFSFY